MLALFFILFPITIFSIYSAIAGDKVGNVVKTDGESSEGFETINIEKYDNSTIDKEIQVEEETVDEDSKSSDSTLRIQTVENDQDS